MGLAASQARFLGLTARKSNTEYQVQQINQTRTALSNEVMGLYNEYNNLEVPTPPVVTDYMKTTYKIDSTYEDYEIKEFTKIIDGEYAGYYDVQLAWNEDIPKAYLHTAKDALVTTESNTNGAFSYINFQLGVDSYTYDENNPNGSTITKITGDYEKYQGLNTIMESKNQTNGTYYMFVRNNTTYYTSENDLTHTAFENVNGKNQYYGAYTFDYQGTQKIENTASAKAALTQTSNGNLNSIQFIDSPDVQDLEGKAYSITTSRDESSALHDQATADYEYKQALYEKEVQRINLKTKEIQEQDRSLELQLRQLDTEQRALATEMDSVKKVIEDTMDKVFKTFSN